MLRHQPSGIRESMEDNLKSAADSFQLQKDQVRSRLRDQIQRTRQRLSSGMVETAAQFMGPAYAQAAADPGGSGIKRRMLDVLTRYAARDAPKLFLDMRLELSEGVAELQVSMKPQLSEIVGYGGDILKRFQQNLVGPQLIPPEHKRHLQDIVNSLPQINFS